MIKSPAVRVHALAGVIIMCSWARHFYYLDCISLLVVKQTFLLLYQKLQAFCHKTIQEILPCASYFLECCMKLLLVTF